MIQFRLKMGHCREDGWINPAPRENLIQAWRRLKERNVKGNGNREVKDSSRRIANMPFLAGHRKGESPNNLAIECLSVISQHGMSHKDARKIRSTEKFVWQGSKRHSKQTSADGKTHQCRAHENTKFVERCAQKNQLERKC